MFEMVRLFQDADDGSEDSFERRLKVLALMDKIGLFTAPVNPGQPKSGSPGVDGRALIAKINGRKPTA